MSGEKPDKDEAPKQSERERLEAEKIKLAKRLGIWKKFEAEPGYLETEEYRRICEIDKRLFEIINE